MAKMHSPEPTAHHAKLRAFEGAWRGREILHPSPWSPEARTAQGHFECRLGLGGMFLITEYTESRDGAVVFRGHGVYGYCGRTDRYTMHWFDSMGMPPNEARGTWDGDTLTFESAAEHGHGRYVYRFEGQDRFHFSILTSKDGAAWTTLMEGSYDREVAG